eukprot:scaffold138872_cov43-Cyclotella_meneghiniana.AAC.1
MTGPIYFPSSPPLAFTRCRLQKRTMAIAAASVHSWYSGVIVGTGTPAPDLIYRSIRRVCFSACLFPLQD